MNAIRFLETGDAYQGSISVDDDPGRLRDPDALVLEKQEVKIRFTYPLTNDAVFSYQAEDERGFTRRRLMQCIQEGYGKIYEEEEAVSQPSSNALLLNRGRSSGPYGIWGHDLGDLFLEGAQYDEALGAVILIIGS